MAEIKIREFTEDDLDRVVALVRYVVDVSYKDAYPADALRMYKRYHSRENIRNDASSGYCVVAELNGFIVGTGTLVDNVVRRVYINPTYQNTGIGSKIYRDLEEHAAATGISRLELGASVLARGFWESQGWTYNGEEKIPTPHGEELVFFKMSKEL